MHFFLLLKNIHFLRGQGPPPLTDISPKNVSFFGRLLFNSHIIFFVKREPQYKKLFYATCILRSTVLEEYRICTTHYSIDFSNFKVKK